MQVINYPDSTVELSTSSAFVQMHFITSDLKTGFIFARKTLGSVSTFQGNEVLYCRNEVATLLERVNIKSDLKNVFYVSLSNYTIC